MNHKAVEQQLRRLLNSQEKQSRVVALTGLWGSGKTHLWRAVDDTLTAEGKTRSALYASLFGVSSLDEVRLKLMQSAVKLGEAPKEDALKGGASALMKFVESVLPGGKAVSALQHAISPMILANRLLVLDDIERKTVALDTEAVLGFVDEMSQRHGCQVLLILNDEPLIGESDVWSQMREKVVDHELRLSPSPAEAFDMAMEDYGSPSPSWAKFARAAVTKCEIVNIRILKKIRHVLFDILKDQPQLPEAVLDRVTSASTLLTAVYYREIKDVPDIATIAKEHDGSFAWDNFFRDARTKSGLPSTEPDGWKELFRRLGFHQLGDFESALIDYLNSGWLAPPSLRSALEELIARAEEDITAANCHQFLRAEHWDLNLSEQDLLDLAAPIADKAHLLSAAAVSSFVEVVREIPGGEKLAKKALVNWKVSTEVGEVKSSLFDDPFGRKLDPQVEATLARMRDRAYSQVDILAACKTIHQKQGWGDAETRALNGASAEQYKEIITQANGRDLRVLFWALMPMARRGLENSSLQPAIEAFVKACRDLHAESESRRLKRLIEQQFRDNGQALDAST
ncbi:P-loop NTPase fold protein [Achromobacter mucicolens]|uniref:P-loop NTPase fold protein n=1 Tax=Achromobacter mucicolens TaxID=1389922 RepID=UPI0039755F12